MIKARMQFTDTLAVVQENLPILDNFPLFFRWVMQRHCIALRGYVAPRCSKGTAPVSVHSAGPISNLCQETGCVNRLFPWASSASPGECWNTFYTSRPPSDASRFCIRDRPSAFHLCGAVKIKKGITLYVECELQVQWLRLSLTPYLCLHEDGNESSSRNDVLF
jgi:hypothetical protein